VLNFASIFDTSRLRRSLVSETEQHIRNPKLPHSAAITNLRFDSASLPTPQLLLTAAVK